MSTENEPLLDLLRGFLGARDELHLLDTHRIREMGTSPGSLGKTHYLYLLECRNTRAMVLIDLKETYTDSDTEYFYSPVPHHGLRMILASNLYAPGLEQRLGHFTVNDVQYWGREIQSFQVKFKQRLNRRKLVALASSVGAQLGRAHRLSLVEVDPMKVLLFCTSIRSRSCSTASGWSRKQRLLLSSLSSAHKALNFASLFLYTHI